MRIDYSWNINPFTNPFRRRTKYWHPLLYSSTVCDSSCDALKALDFEIDDFCKIGYTVNYKHKIEPHRIQYDV